MKIVIKSKNFKLTPTLYKYIEEKIGSLEKFIKILYSEDYFNHFFGKGKPRFEAWVEIGRTILDQRKGPIFFAECQMRFPKRSLRAEAKNKDLKLAINEVKDELQRELKEYKEVSITQAKRGARIAKKELKISPQARFYRKGRIREET